MKRKGTDLTPKTMDENISDINLHLELLVLIQAYEITFDNTILEKIRSLLWEYYNV